MCTSAATSLRCWTSAAASSPRSSFANSPEGMPKLRAWLVAHDAGEAVVGVESPAGYGRLLVASLEAAGHEVLNVPAWRTHRERHRHGPGKTDPGDAIAVAQLVLRKRSELGPALEPELVRAVALLELQRRRLVRDRTQAIQRLRADWNQVDPVGEARVVNLTRERELRRLKRISFGDGSSSRSRPAASATSPATSRTSTSASPASTTEIAQLLAEHGNPVSDLHGAGHADRRRSDRARRRRPPLPQRRGLRPLLRRRTNPLWLRPNSRSAPAPPRRQPPTQRRPLPHRHRPSPPPPTSPHLPRPQDRRRQDTPRSPPSAETPPRQRHLPPPLHLGRSHTSTQHVT